MSEPDEAQPAQSEPIWSEPVWSEPAQSGSAGSDAAAVESPAPLSVLDRLADEVEWPDSDAEVATRARLGTRAKPVGGLGRLEELAVWMAGTQGSCPPHEPRRVRLVVFAADHGIADAGVSADPPGTTALRVAATHAGTAISTILAAVVGASVRLVDMGVDTGRGGGTDPDPAPQSASRRISGRIDRVDAMTFEETVAAIEAGARIADEEVDAGADLLIAGDVGVGSTTMAAVMVAVMTNTEPVKVVGRGSGIDDEAWSRKVAAIRDARRRGMPERNDMTALLGRVGGPDLAAITGFLLRAAARRTPVLLDGLVVGAAALVAREASPRAIRWWQSADRGTEPAHTLTLEQLPLEPLLELQLAVGEGAGALLSVPLLRAAVRAVSDLDDGPVPHAPGPGPEPEPTVDHPVAGAGATQSADVGLDKGGLDQPGG